MSVPFSARLVAGDSVVVNTFSDGESVLLNLDTEHYYGLNASGTQMWQRLTSAPSIEAAYTSLRNDFETVESGELRDDLAELIESLLDTRLAKLELVGDRSMHDE